MKKALSFMAIFFVLFTTSKSQNYDGKFEVNSKSDISGFNYSVEWNTFIGSTINDYGKHVAVDDSGNVYLIGHSRKSWGEPVNNHAGGNDAFVTKLNSSGMLLWNTFIGGTGNDSGDDIAVNRNGNIYVTGTSYRTWGSPVNAFTVGDGGEVFVAKLNSSGELEWNTFMGSSSDDQAESIAADNYGNVFVNGNSIANWGSPVNAFAGGDDYDAFAAKLNSNGVLVWNTFMGSTLRDWGESITVGRFGNVYITGDCDTTWGSPIHSFNGKKDAFIVKLGGAGELKWNTFIGGSYDDWGKNIVIDGNVNIYVAGSSLGTWGTPAMEFAGGNSDAFAAKLDFDGNLKWNTFMGGEFDDWAKGIAIDGSENVYIAGYSSNTWGSPVNPFNDGSGNDIFIAKLNNPGVLEWNTFMGSPSNDLGKSITLDNNGNIYVSGHSDASWGMPVNPHSGGEDAFVIKLNQPQIKFTAATSILLRGVDNSSAAWGDYDNDGDLDILLTGNSHYGLTSKIYRNEGNDTFSEQNSISLVAIQEGDAAWGDYDNDGDLDILLAGSSHQGLISKIYRNEGNNTFSEQTSISLIGIYNSSVAWGDYDNDGDLDILLAGNSNNGPISKIYRNEGNNTFSEQTSISLVGMRWSSASWGDYDNDKDLDIILAGDYVSKIYRNEGNNTFIEQTSISLSKFLIGEAVWGDYNSDGFLDILLFGGGVDAAKIAKIYKNNGDNTFTWQKQISITGLAQSSVAWGDYDNDGDLDIVGNGIIGCGSEGCSAWTEMYTNNGDETYSELSPKPVLDVLNGSCNWGDYDNDGDLDLLLTGHDGSHFYAGFGDTSIIYQNNSILANSIPNAPINLNASIMDGKVFLSWDKATDSETPQDGLSYNIVIGTTPGGEDILSPMSDRLTGYRKIVKLGNANLNTSWVINDLAPGKYYWSVQSIDNNFSGSPFAEEQTFIVPFNISYKITLPNCDDPDSSVEVGSGQIKEGENIIIPEYELPAEYKEFQKYYDALAGSEIGIPVGSLNENIEFDINFEGICENGLIDDPNTQDIIELLFLSVNIIGETSGSHNLLEYYYFENDNEAYIKIPITNLEPLKELFEFDINSLTPFFIDNGLKPDFKGIRKEIDAEYFTIYTKHFSELKLGIATSPTGIGSELNELPTEFSLSQNYPNPFNPSTIIKYSIPSNLETQDFTFVQLKVYDILGKEVAELVSEPQNAGYYEVNFDASNHPSGIYYYQLKAGSFVETKKMLMLK